MLRTAVGVAAITSASPGLALAQASGGEWTTSGGDAQRTSWVRFDERLTREAVDDGQFQFLWKAKFDNESPHGFSLTEPMLQDRLIGYRGFKALGFVGGSADRIFAIDTDLARPSWTTHVTYAAATGGLPPSTPECPGGLVAAPSRRTNLAPSAFGGGGGGGARAVSAVGEPGKGAAVLSEVRKPSAPAPQRDVAPPLPPSRTSGPLAPVPFGGVDPLYVVGSDGMLRTLRVSDGAPTSSPLPFLPPSSRPSALTYINGVVYAATTRECGAAPNGLWALDLAENNKVTTWTSGAANIAGSAGPSFSTTGTIYVATSGVAAAAGGERPGRRNLAAHANSVVALDPATLTPRDWLSTADADFNASPIVFRHKDRELVVVSGGNGRLYLLDAASLGGADHKTPLFVSGKYTGSGESGLATWERDGTRWIVATVTGGPGPGLAFTPNGPAPAGSLVAFTLSDADGQLTLVPAWRSRNLASPMAPLVVNGMVVAVSRPAPRAGAPAAVLYLLDAATGKQLWTSGAAITSRPGARLSAGSGQVYLVTADNHLYAFGIPMEH